MNPYFSNENVTIYHGDSLEVLPEIQFATCVALDPPYSMVPNSFSGKDDGAAGTSAAPVKLLAETLKHTRRMLPEGGCAGLICDWRRLPDVTYMATLFGLRINTCVAWTRNTAGMGKLFRSAWDPMLVLSSGTPKVKDNAGIKNVYHENKPRGSSHPYEKPVGLWLHLFNRLPAGVLVDPYAGTGSALEAGIMAGHKVIGIEADEKYCELMVKRLAKLRQPTQRAVDLRDSAALQALSQPEFNLVGGADSNPPANH